MDHPQWLVASASAVLIDDRRHYFSTAASAGFR